jgi:hypothetical protein
MTLPTAPFAPTPVGKMSEGGGSGSLGGLAALDSGIYRDMRWCAQCGGEKIFMEVFEFDSGRVGVCLGCGEEKFVAFTRTVGEAA